MSRDWVEALQDEIERAAGRMEPIDLDELLDRSAAIEFDTDLDMDRRIELDRVVAIEDPPGRPSTGNGSRPGLPGLP